MSVRTRRWSVATALLVSLAVIVTSCTRNGEAWESLSRVNDARAARGLPTLAIDDVLVDKAQNWAEHMARTGSVRHSVLSADVGGGWRALGENVGWARSVEEAHNLFMNSSAHRGAILSGRYSKIGTGVAIVGGRYYVVQVFGG